MGPGRRPSLIALFTDFGPHGPYLGQMRLVLAGCAPDCPVVDLLNDAPAFDPAASAHLLAALTPDLPRASVLLGVVDPGVGTHRTPVALQADERWYVGPDNGLFDVVAARAEQASWYDITWRPERLSTSFHGRDLFAPVAGHLARGGDPAQRLVPRAAATVNDADRSAVIYIDDYGNAMTGLRARTSPTATRLLAAQRHLPRAETFGAVAPGEAFWYVNSLGLAEVAVNQGSAADQLGLAVGSPVTVVDP